MTQSLFKTILIQGVKLVPNTHLRDPNKLIRLWCHEVYRVFYDRMVDEDDRISFFNLVKSNGQDQFKVDLTKILFPHVLGGSSVVSDEHLRTICFGDYMHPEAEKKVCYYFIFKGLSYLKVFFDIMSARIKLIQISQ